MDPLRRPHLVSTVHGFYSVNVYSAIMTRGERVIAVSDSIRDYILENYPKVQAERIRVVPRGVKLEQYPRDFSPSAEWLATWRGEQPRCAGRVVLLLPGRITRLKGHEDFFNLIVALKKQGLAVQGLVVGDTHAKKTEYLSELRAKVDALGLGDDVSFLGHRRDLREIMAVSDVTYSLSQQPESFGRVALEALAMGRAFVGYDHGGIGEQLRPAYPTGCVTLGDQPGLLAATLRVLKERPVPGPIGEPYTLDCMCSSTLAVYKELVTNP
jgi:glycosyltransferase involved in cell wall biosynthesis